jgi:hypothetical protein
MKRQLRAIQIQISFLYLEDAAHLLWLFWSPLLRLDLQSDQLLFVYILCSLRKWRFVATYQKIHLTHLSFLFSKFFSTQHIKNQLSGV